MEQYSVVNYTDVSRFKDGVYQIEINDLSDQTFDRVLTSTLRGFYDDAFIEAQKILSHGQHSKAIGTNTDQVNTLILVFPDYQYQAWVFQVQEQFKGWKFYDIDEVEDILASGVKGVELPGHSPLGILDDEYYLSGKRLISVTSIEFDYPSGKETKVFVRLQFNVEDDFLDHHESMLHEMRDMVNDGIREVARHGEKRAFTLHVPLFMTDHYAKLFTQLLRKHNDYRRHILGGLAEVSMYPNYNQTKTMEYVPITFK